MENEYTKSKLYGFEIGEHVKLNENDPEEPWKTVINKYKPLIRELRRGTPTVQGTHWMVDNINIRFKERTIGVPYTWLISAEPEINIDKFEKLL